MDTDEPFECGENAPAVQSLLAAGTLVGQTVTLVFGPGVDPSRCANLSGQGFRWCRICAYIRAVRARYQENFHDWKCPLANDFEWCNDDVD